MLQAFQEHVDKHFTELKQEKFLLACSGGIDSMVLVHLCKALNFQFSMAHCNFQLRGRESELDEVFVLATAATEEIAVYVRAFDVTKYMNEQKQSLQMAARELRYTWFNELMQEKGYKTLVTAHHADDNLETFIINLSRGTGIEGLKGIPSKTANKSRPLLPFSRSEIEAYAKLKGIKWREDKSNTETKYLRNKIRHDVVPLLKELHPTFLANFMQTQSYIRDASKLLAGYIENLKTKLVVVRNDVIEFQVADLISLEPLELHLYVLLKEYGFTAWNDIADLLSASSGKEVHSKTHRLVKDRKKLLLTTLKQAVAKEIYQINEANLHITAPVQLDFEEVTDMTAHGPEVLFVDKKTLKYPLSVRKWKNGDYFYPLGMQGKKKLSKYFKDEKVDVISKDKQWLLCSGDDIVWIIGRRADSRFRVAESTENIIKITLNK